MEERPQGSARTVDKKRIRISEIAKLANVAIGTVDRALHNRNGISKATRQKILAIAESAGYRPNIAARILRVGHANLRIGVCIPRPYVFYEQIRDGILAEARRVEHLGVEVFYWPLERLGAGEMQRVKEITSKDIQGLILTPGNPTQLEPLIDEAEQKNIRVICVASDAASSSRSSVVCVQPELNGRLAAELMSWLVPTGSQVAVITGMLHTEDHLKKTEGFSKVFPRYCRGGQVVDVIEGHEDDDLMFRKCLELLEEKPTLSGLYINIGLSLPVCSAIDARKLSGKVRVIGTDLFKEMVPFLKKGTIAASIYQRPFVQGQHAVRLIVDHILAGRPIPATHYLNPNIVMRSNLDLFRETHLSQHVEGAQASTYFASPETAGPRR